MSFRYVHIAFCILFLMTMFLSLTLEASGQKRQRADTLLDKPILFDSSAHHLYPYHKKKLERIASYLSGRPGFIIALKGYTDTTGTLDYNQHLSEKRAMAAAEYLYTLGVPKSAIQAKGFGERKPSYRNGRRYYSSRKSRAVYFQKISVIKGQVVYSGSKKRVANADVAVSAPGMVDLRIRTNERGEFELWPPYKKTLILSISKQGFLSRTDTLRLNDKESGGAVFHKELPLREAIIKDRIEFQNMYFYAGSARILPSSEPALKEIYDLLQQDASTHLEIVGHVSQPNRQALSNDIIEQGRELSFKRARAIIKALEKMGADITRISGRGAGSDFMINPMAETEEDNQANQRVEVFILMVK